MRQQLHLLKDLLVLEVLSLFIFQGYQQFTLDFALLK
jgi:hypothetical protein